MRRVAAPAAPQAKAVAHFGKVTGRRPVACSSPNEPRPPTTDTSNVSSGDPVPGFETYDEGFPALMRRWNIPGAAVAVAPEGKIVFSRGYGLADKETGRQVLPDTTFRIMSVTKMFTAALVMRLVEQGTLSLDDKVFDLLPYPTPTYPGAQRDPRLANITVRHLLSHKGGWGATDATNPIVGGRGFNPTNYQRQIAQIMGIPAAGTPDTIISLPDLTWTTLSWSDWKRRWSLSPSANPTDDPNDDGWSLLMEYAAGLNPLSEEKAAPLHTTTDEAGHVTVGYQRLPLDTEVFWSLETSNDGNNWTATPKGNALRRVSSDGLLTISVNIGQASRVRLKVILKQTGDTSLHELRIE